MVDMGTGIPLVVIPGIQGRWEWMRPAVEALAGRCRVITSSLPGTPRGAGKLEPDDHFDGLMRFIDELLDGAGVQQAAICGVSFGGLIALRYAARRRERVRALILVSTPGPRWRPDRRTIRCMRWPTLCGPLFFVGAVGRMWPELRETFPEIRQRALFCARMLPRVLGAPAIPQRMARLARLAAAERFEDDCSHVSVPTLVMTGERDLDRVVSVDATLEYVSAIAGARFRLLENTGHLGIATAPSRFAAAVSDFVNGLDTEPSRASEP